MASYVPDLTGLNPDCNIIGYLKTIFKSNQKIYFPIPAYDNENLKVYKIGATNILLTKNIDYVIQEDDIDYDAISNLKNIDENFNKTLIKSLTFIRPFTEQYKVSIDYNQIYISSYIINTTSRYEDIDISKDLIGEMLNKVNNLDFTVKSIINSNNNLSSESFNVKILGLDLNKENYDNFIQDEIHTINTIDGVYIIRPRYGSFFRDSVIIKSYVGEVLKENIDYEIFGFDNTKTKMTTNSSGVYNFIKITKTFVGEVSISYHAFGGELSVGTAESFLINYNNLLEYIKQEQYVTSDKLSSMKVIQDLKNKISDLEDVMRRLLGDYTYGDSTSGLAIIKKIRSLDNNYHYWNIASLYKVANSEDICIADTFKFRLKSNSTNTMFECIVSFNPENSDKELDVKVLSCNTPNNNNLIKPRVRVIYNKDENTYSGAILQLGFQLVNSLEETICIEDLSGKESCWKLDKEVQESILPQDNNVILPDESLYDENVAISKSVKKLLKLDGIVLFDGEKDLQITDPNYVGAETVDNIFDVEDNLDIDELYDLDKIKILLEVTTETNITFNVELVGLLSTSNGKRILALSDIDIEDNIYGFNCILYIENDNDIKCNLWYYDRAVGEYGAPPPNNTVKCKKITLF